MSVTRRGAGLWLVAAWALFFAPHLLSGEVPFYRDQLMTNLPLRAYLRERLLAGELPQWLPFEGLGVPFIGQIVTQTFHPLSWLLLPLSAPLAGLVGVLAAYALALWSAYLLGRCFGVSREAALAGAVAFGFGGYALGVSNNLVYLLSHATLPLVGVAAHRLVTRLRWRDVPLLGGAWGLVFLAGDAQGALLAGGLVLAIALVRGPPRRAWVLLAASGVLALAVSAAELLPALVVSGESARRLDEAASSRGSIWALAPLRLPELLLGGYLPDVVRFRLVQDWLSDERTSVWSTTITFGAAALLPLLIGIRARGKALWPLLALLLLTLWLALGVRGGLWTIATQLVLPLGLFRYPEKYLSVVWVASVPFVALGVDVLRARASEFVTRVALGAAAFLAIGAALGSRSLVATVLGWRSSSLAADTEVVSAVSSAWLEGALVAGGALAVGAALLWGSRRVTWSPSLWGAVLFGELLLANGAHLPLVSPAFLEAPNPFADAVREAADASGPSRVISLSAVQVPMGVTLDGGEAWVTATRRSLGASVAVLDGVPSFRINVPLMPWRMALLRTAATETPSLIPRFHVCFGTGALTERLQGSVLLRDPEVGLQLTRWPCRDRAFFAEVRPVADAKEAAQRLKTSPDATWWEGCAPLPKALGTLEWLTSKPEHLALRVDVPTQAGLVVLDQFAPGWSATIDGVPASISPVDVAARGVLVPAGQHLVEFRYQTPRLWAGLAVTGAGWLALLSLMAVPRARRLRGR